MATEYSYARVPDTIPGFITVTSTDKYRLSIAVSAITVVAPEEFNGKTVTFIGLVGSRVTGHYVTESHADIMALIHKAQHPAS